MRIKSFLFVSILAGLSAAAACPARAQDTFADERVRHVRAHDAGSVEGRVVFVDRVRGRIVLDSPRGRYDIMVPPSAAIAERGGGFDTIADIRRGQRVQVFLSERAGVYFAQIIRLRGER